MKYTKDEKLSIAKEVVDHELTYNAAAKKYSVSLPSIANWVRLYRCMNNITIDKQFAKNDEIESLQQLTKEQLIDEVIKARIGEERAKKGYEVKGGGQKKEYVSLYNKNTK